VLTEQWTQRLTRTGVHVHAMHPARADTAGIRNWMPVFRALTRPIIRTPGQGAETIVWLGGAPEAIETTGSFWHDRRPRPVTYLIGAGADDAARRGTAGHRECPLRRRSGASRGSAGCLLVPRPAFRVRSHSCAGPASQMRQALTA
jgi:hypothetical protein